MKILDLLINIKEKNMLKNKIYLITSPVMSAGPLHPLPCTRSICHPAATWPYLKD